MLSGVSQWSNIQADFHQRFGDLAGLHAHYEEGGKRGLERDLRSRFEASDLRLFFAQPFGQFGLCPAFGFARFAHKAG